MIEFLSKLANRLFGTHLEFRVRLFNVLAVTGTIVSGFNCIPAYFFKEYVPALLCVFGALFGGCILWYVTVSGKYIVGYIMTIFAVFLCMFPAIFLTSEYRIATVSYFTFAVLFTVFMLKGKLMIFFVVLEIAVYTACCFYVCYLMPDFTGDKSLMQNVLIDFITSTISLSIALALHFRLYDRQQKELVAARQKAEAYTKLKSDLVAEMSHELRTPLAVISGYAQYAVEQIRKKGISVQTLAELGTVSEEARRLAELADNTLDILKSSREIDENGNFKREAVDVGILVEKVTSLQKPVAERISIDLRVRIEDGLPCVIGNSGELTQVIWNILQNAIIHSGGDVVTIEAKRNEDTVNISVTDNGDGIPQHILSGFSGRGASVDEGKSGLGLPLSREIAQNHGGDIIIASRSGTGTRIVMSLPITGRAA